MSRMGRMAVLVCALGLLAGSAEAARLGLVISTQDNPFFVTLKEGAEARAKELGHDLTVWTP